MSERREYTELEVDHAVREWSTSHPQLREDVKFHYQRDRGDAVYVIEDLANRKYVQIGLPEYQFLRGLDGKLTVGELLAVNARRHRQYALDEGEVISLLRWLLDQGLLRAENSDQLSRRLDAGEKKPKKKSQGIMKILFCKIPLGNPDRFFGLAAAIFGWTFSRAFFLLWLIGVAAALFLAAKNFRELGYTLGGVILPSNWLILLLVFVGLKFIHELWHGIAMKRYGGVVPEWGVQMIALITPLTYVDASASWSLPSRRKRWTVAAAGMYIELGIAAVAMIVWALTSPGLLNTIAANVVLVASFITVLFNANPLMRFDGYYMLSDAMGIRNLASKGMMMLNWLGKTVVLGVKNLPLPMGTRQHRIFLGTYGIAAGVWRIILMTGILILVASLFRGAGIIIAVLALVASLVTMTVKFVRYLMSRERGLRLPVACLRMALLAAILVLPLIVIKIHPEPKAPFVVRYGEKERIRVDCPGFVSEVVVKDGETVEEGQLLVRLNNREEVALLKKIEIDLRRVELESREHFGEDRQAFYEAAQKRVEGLKERRDSQKERIVSLELRSPVAGRVVGHQLENLGGQYFKTGDELMMVLPEEEMELVISASPKSLDSLDGGTLRTVDVRLPSRDEDYRAGLTRIESKATAALPHPALSAAVGGALPVRQATEQLSDREKGLVREAYQSEAQSHFSGLQRESMMVPQELMRPRLAVYAAFLGGNLISKPLREGEWGYVRFSGGKEEALGKWIGHHFYEFVIEGITGGSNAN